MTEIKKNLVCWAVSDGRAGIEANCLGLAAAMGLVPIIHHAQMKSPWKWLPPALIPLHTGIYDASLFPPKDAHEESWPDIIIGCGRQSALFTALVRKLSKGKTFAIQIQDPKVSPDLYDLVVTPEHDRLRGPNVLTTCGALNKITPDLLELSKKELAPRIADLPRPLVAVLIGGKSKAYDLTENIIHQLGNQLQNLHQKTGCGFLLTTSRRTGQKNEALLSGYLKDLPAFVWDGQSPNPYFGFLGSADAIIVTSDSVNMVTEAASTGRPVFTVDLAGGTKKFDRFHQKLRDDGIIRPFNGTLETWLYPPLCEAQRIAKIILKKLDNSGRR
ncbi:mitochondrial fission ELM1 family protein [uncultured Kiloniella sp.]|uniref:mitochondrial fission ELM1 family protein n=1 Tax=uncultured Kiloniella sp. TaxID=1133091 RepID=UPI002628A4F9|nr:mitochondrial fission ELM1 family protein [uncultured Kiloniella sp.]